MNYIQQFVITELRERHCETVFSKRAAQLVVTLTRVQCGLTHPLYSTLIPVTASQYLPQNRSLITRHSCTHTSYSCSCRTSYFVHFILSIIKISPQGRSAIILSFSFDHVLPEVLTRPRFYSLDKITKTLDRTVVSSFTGSWIGKYTRNKKVNLI